MRCFWEQTGVLGPIYRLLGQGLNDGDIASKLDLTEVKVQSCVALDTAFLEPEDSSRVGSICFRCSVTLSIA
jgi:hypothetical protein